MTTPLCPSKDFPNGQGMWFSLRTLLSFVTIVAIAFGLLPWVKQAHVIRQYNGIRYLVETGEWTEDHAREQLGEDYPAYREFVDRFNGQ